VRRRQGGQALVFIALLSAVLVGFVGLAIDGGAIASRQSQAQSAADGAALTAADAVSRGQQTTAAATVLALDLVAATSLPAADLALSYLDTSGVATANITLIRSVTAVITDDRPTYFLKALGVPTVRVMATGKSTVYGLPNAAPCALCVLAAAGNSLSLGNSATLAVTGAPVAINSTGNPNLSLASSSSFTAIGQSITYPTGGTVVNAGTTLSPAPVIGPLVSDPFSRIAVPVGVGAQTSFNSSGNSALAPGVYTSITVNPADTVTLSAGVFVLTGTLSIRGTLLTAAGGVVFYLRCPGAPNPVACPVGGGPGGRFSLTSGGVGTISAAATGLFRGMAVIADPLNNATSSTNSGTITFNGTYRAPLMTFSTLRGGDRATFNSQVIVANLLLNATSNATVTWTALGNYASPALIP
jgi:hypothetical protein